MHHNSVDVRRLAYGPSVLSVFSCRPMGQVQANTGRASCLCIRLRVAALSLHMTVPSHQYNQSIIRAYLYAFSRDQ
jgi:hypothetical protein